MADKTTTLKTKTNDNVYPNVIGDNRDNAISDSPQIKHTLTANHKINFRLDTNVNNLINNSLQKPAGLTKTKLVGVGANGQENIEIGDNLTLANGKLSATGGGSGGDVFEFVIADENLETYTGTITGTKPVIRDTIVEGYWVSNIYVDDEEGKRATFTQVLSLGGGEVAVITLVASNGKITMSEAYFKEYYTHFITLTNDNDKIYLQYQNKSANYLNVADLTSVLSGKKVLCTGVLGNSDETLATPLYVSGEAGGLDVYYVLKNDTSGTISSKSITSFTMTDLVTTVE